MVPCVLLAAGLVRATERELSGKQGQPPPTTTTSVIHLAALALAPDRVLQCLYECITCSFQGPPPPSSEAASVPATPKGEAPLPLSLSSRPRLSSLAHDHELDRVERTRRTPAAREHRPPARFRRRPRSSPARRPPRPRVLRRLVPAPARQLGRQPKAIQELLPDLARQAAGLGPAHGEPCPLSLSLSCPTLGLSPSVPARLPRR